MEQLKPETLQLLGSALTFVIWIIRLEAKVKSLERDLNGLGKKAYRLESESYGNFKTLEISVAKLEVKQDIK